MATTKKTSHTNAVADKAHKAIDDAASFAETVEKKARVAGSDAIEQAEAALSNVKDAGHDTQIKVMDYVNDKPLQSLGIAFGAGLLVSMILRKQ